MTDPVDTQQALLEHAQRQTKALENINVVLMFFLAVALVGVAFLIIGALTS